MIPVKLTIQGLYSYRQPQIIQFDKLTNAGLFGLFGGVGSGKSTILEAVSFALYGESERLNKNDQRNYNMMNLKSNELLIDFEFKTGAEARYRFTVSGKRNGKRFDDVKPFARSAYRWANGQWEPMAETTAEKVTGLSYDNFRRTIIIPQGKFQEFLQLSPKDRTSMLMELFNLEKYDLAGKVNGMEIRNNEAIQNLKGQLLSLGDVTPQWVDDLQKQLIGKQDELKLLVDNVKQQQQTVQALKQLKELQEKALNQKTKVDALTAQGPENLRLESELKEYEQLVLAFKGDLEQMKAASQKIAEAEKLVQIDDAKLVVDGRRLEQIQAEFDKLKSDFDKKEQLLRQADELKMLAQAAKLSLQVKELQIRIDNGKRLLAEKTESVAALKTQLATLKAQDDQTRRLMPDMGKLMQVKEWFVHQKTYAAAVDETQKRLAAQQKAISDETALAFAALLPLGMEQDALELAGLPLRLDAEKEKTQALQTALQQSRTVHEVNRQLKSFADGLHDGDACPLCGSDHHPHVYSATDADSQLLHIDKELALLAQRTKQLDTARAALAHHLTKIGSYQQQTNTDSKLLAEWEAKLLQHARAFVWTDLSPAEPQKADEWVAFAQQNAKVVEQLAKQIEEIGKSIDKAEAEKEKYAKALEQIERDRLGITSQMETLKSQVTTIDIRNFANDTEPVIMEKATVLLARHRELVDTYAKTDRERQRLTQETSLLKGKIDATRQTLAAMADDHQKLADRIGQKLAQAGGESLEHVETVLQKQMDAAAVRQRIDQWKNDMAAATELWKSLQNELQGNTFDTRQYDQAVLQLADASARADEWNQAIGRITNQIKELQVNLSKKEQLTAQLEKLQLRAANLTELKNMFRSSGFVNYVSTVYLHNLCAAANDRFYRLTRQHLSLELADDNSFQVRDFLNEGRLRSVKTLSGGQTFQASLSLALALADSVRHLSSGNENFFFLDEGFGTLDRESLAIVFDTLKSLRKENRIVGVISHVDEMQQEIDTYLKITNNEETGSVVVASWEAEG